MHAVELLAAKLRERPHTLIPVGPLTNIALLLAIHPELAGRIERIVIMGGAYGLGNVTPEAEFNIWADPEAAHRVFAAGLNLTMIGLDVTHRAMLSAARADALRDAGKAGAVVADLHRFYRRFHLEVYGHDDTPVHDALAVASVIDPELLTLEPHPVVVDVAHGPCRGRTVVDRLRRPVRGRPGRRPPPPHRRRAERARRDGRRRRRLHRPADEPDRQPAVTEYPFQRRLGAVPLRNGRTEFRVWSRKPVPLRVQGTEHPLQDAGFDIYEATLDAAP